MRRVYAVRQSRTAAWAKLCGGVAVPILVLAALGARAGLIPSAALLPALVVGFILGLLAFGIAVYALIDIWNSGAEGARSAVAAIVYSLPVLAVLGLVAAGAIAYPRLTDVTTNVVDPPEFIGVRAPSERPPRADLVLQQQSYPDIVTRNYPLPLGQVYSAARKIIEGRGWTIVRDSRPEVMPQAAPEPSSPREGVSEDVLAELARKSVMTQSRRGPATQTLAGEPAATLEDLIIKQEDNVATMEAIAPTLVFGLRDSVVVRLRGSVEGTVVDMRSASGVGAHDLGQNARRIRGFFKKLDAELQPGGATSRGLLSAIR